MTETITLPAGQVAESPRTPRPASDGAAFASKDMPGRQRDIQDCVDKILAKVDPTATAG